MVLIGLATSLLSTVGGVWLLQAGLKSWYYQTFPSRIVVGADGVTLHPGTNRRRYVPFRLLSSVLVKKTSVMLFDGGDVIAKFNTRTTDGANTLGEAIEKAKAKYTLSGDQPIPPCHDALERRDRPLSKWRQALKGLFNELPRLRC